MALPPWTEAGAILMCHLSPIKDKRMKRTTGNFQRRQMGFKLIEVVIGIFIFAVGIMGLVFLQGSLVRGQSDAQTRSVAVNLGDQLIERTRGFGRLETDPAGLVPAYQDIRESASGFTGNQSVGGIEYTTSVNLLDFRWDGDSFECFQGELDNASDSRCITGTVPAGLFSDYKLMEVKVAWVSPEFRVEEGLATSDRLGSGEIVVSGIISSVPTTVNSRVSTPGEQSLDEPPTPYSPGDNPDIIALSLGQSKFKESTTPLPDVIRTGKVETEFDVVTYSGVGDEEFIRREQFRTVSCECRMQAANESNVGRRPVVWAGDEYVRGHEVPKVTGTSATQHQSPQCARCCRDHHDGGASTEDHVTDSGANRYSPFKASDEYQTSGQLAGDHNHYQWDGVTLARAGDVYLEACRLVRVDGFWRVAQDFRREDQYLFPEDFLDAQNEINLYSNYATGAALAYEQAATVNYEAAPPCLGGPSPCVAEPAMQADYPAAIATDGEGHPTEFPSWSTLPFGAFATETQQLRSRGLYIDYLSKDLRSVISCLNVGGNAESCQTGDVVLDKTGSANVLELIPFFDVQLTLLDRWNEYPTNTPVDTTNDAIADNNAHSRGLASRNGEGSSLVKAKSHRGNLGFTDTPPIDPVYASYVSYAPLDMEAQGDGGGGPPPVASYVVGGPLSETLPGNVDITVTGMNSVQCGQTAATYTCVVAESTEAPAVLVSGYGKMGRTRWACSELPVMSQVSEGVSAQTIFSLDDVAAGTGWSIVVKEGEVDPC
jgi:Tfp pilus assembly protein PilV